MSIFNVFKKREKKEIQYVDYETLKAQAEKAEENHLFLELEDILFFRTKDIFYDLIKNISNLSKEEFAKSEKYFSGHFSINDKVRNYTIACMYEQIMERLDRLETLINGNSQSKSADN